MSNLKDSVYIIIPVHNRKEISLRCLETLKMNGDLERYHTVIVDDGSTDGTHQAITEHYPDVIILQGDGNLWWTGAMKMGMEYAYAQGADYIIWLNDDVIPKPNTLSSLINFLQNHPHSIAAPTCLADSHRIIIPNGCIGNTPIIASPNQVIAVQSVSGYCVAFPAEICQTSGYPDSRKYPHYSGDDMYTLQAHRQGFAIYLLGGVEVILINYQPNTDKRKLTEYIHYPFHQATKLTFFQIKSPFYLPSQYNYLTQKYNLFIGSLLFLIKMTRWLILFSYYLLIANIHHESPTSP